MYGSVHELVILFHLTLHLFKISSCVSTEEEFCRIRKRSANVSWRLAFCEFNGIIRDPLLSRINIVECTSLENAHKSHLGIMSGNCMNRGRWTTTAHTTVLVFRIWKETKQEPVTVGPGNMLGCCLVSFPILWAILSTSTVHARLIIISDRNHARLLPLLPTLSNQLRERRWICGTYSFNH